MRNNENQPRRFRGLSAAFGSGIALNLAYIIVETTFGIAVNSTALLADAGHNLSDVLGLGLAWGGAALARSPTNSRRTYGMRKATVLAAFLNALLLLVAVGAILLESIKKMVHPEPVGGITMMMVAGVGVVVNSLTALLFSREGEKDLNIKGAFVHMAADAGVSLGVVLAGLLVLVTGAALVDSIVSILIAIVIAVGTWSLLRDSFHLSMDAVPRDVTLDEVQRYLGGVNGVTEVHDLHVWAMSTVETALTAHLVVPGRGEPYNNAFLARIAAELRSRFGITHSTIQIEAPGGDKGCETKH